MTPFTDDQVDQVWRERAHAHRGTAITIRGMAREAGIPYITLYTRIARGLRGRDLWEKPKEKTFLGLTFKQWGQLLNIANIKANSMTVYKYVLRHVVAHGHHPHYVLQVMQENYNVTFADELWATEIEEEWKQYVQPQND